MKNHCLIVDDNAHVRRATAHLVEHFTGAEVICCNNANEALDVIREKPGLFACAIIDLNMPPGMDGLELGTRLQALESGMRLILATGSPGSIEGVDIFACGFHCMLPKPLNLHEFRMALHPVLPLLNDFPVARSHDLYTREPSFLRRRSGIHRAAA